ncbi:hypothetical protein TrLO_g3002 [Triparma laevis f. longispina]|uniref:ABC transporter domain-containing protein n=2 Tax=Triparma laevis TaxID=1534972 RepID=A0A9W7CEW4_9STRA|nr:hypothetical protein TrLO_g3002 [Triparma laevis f. longispina]
MISLLLSLTVTLLLLPFTLSLTFQNLTYTHPSLKNPILTSLSGTIPPSSLTYIIGPSGSGKTSLINILTNRVTSGSITGSIFDDDNVAYVTQDDGLHAFLTVQETVDFWIDLLLPKLIKDDRRMKGDEFINKFNLDKSRKTLIGNAKIRGISGGERKRLSILLSLILPKSYLFLDEPFSGLDTTSIELVQDCLKNLREKEGVAIVIVSHDLKNVGGEIWGLSEGKIVYRGGENNVEKFFKGKGIQDVRDLEKMMDVLTKGVDFSDERDFMVREGDNNDLILKKNTSPLLPTREHNKKKSLCPPSSFIRQTLHLTKRALIETYRSRGSTIIKAITQVSIGLIYGTLYQIKNNQAGVYDRFGLLSLISIGGLNLSLAGTIRAFPKERVLIKKEQSERLFSIGPYFISKALSGLPVTVGLSCLFGSVVYPLTGLNPERFKTFLSLLTVHSVTAEALGLLISSLSGSEEKALAFFAPLTVLQVIFDGRNLSYENTPRFLRPLQGLSLVRLNWQSLAINEFKGLKFSKKDRRGKNVIESGDDALEIFGIEGSIWDRVKKQLKFVGVCWGMAVATLVGGGGFVRIKDDK